MSGTTTVDARFTTVHGAQVTLTTTVTYSPYSKKSTWICDCGTTPWPLGQDDNQLRASANEHARTCLVTPPTPTA